MRWEFDSLPGHHDMGDAMYIAYMLADYVGMGTGGQVVAPVTRKRYSQKDLTRR